MVYPIIGPILALVASASAAVGSILMKYLKELSAVLLVTAWQFIIGSIPLFIFSNAVELPDYRLLINPKFIGILLLLALVGTAFGSVAWYLLIQRYEVGRLSLGLFLVPVFGLGVAMLSGERLGGIELSGAVIIVVAILLSTLSPGQWLTDRGWGYRV